MNLRFWGGWFLVIMIIGIGLTMGCEKGALGVKSATVTGKIVDRDNPNIPIANAIVHMMSHSPVGDSPLVQGPNYLNTTTNANGEFIFENVEPDNVVLEVEANGYSKIQYPETTADSNASSTSSALTAQVTDVYVKSGSVTDLGVLSMRKIANPLPQTIHASILLRDATSMEPISETAGPVTISFNNQTFTLPVSNWKDGIDATGNPITLSAESSFNVIVKANSKYYLTQSVTMPGSSDISTEILLTPVSYNLLLRCTHVPDYIEGGVVNVFAETIGGSNPLAPPKVIATQSINNLGNLTTPNLPVLLKVPGLALPVNLRVQVRGYEDEVMQINSNNLPAGTQGNYRIDINFLYDDGVKGNSILSYDPVVASQAGLFDNMRTRPVQLMVSGKDLLDKDTVSVSTSLPYKGGILYNNGVTTSALPIQCQNNQPVSITFNQMAVGYNMNWAVTVSPSITGLDAASGSYTITNSSPDMINVPVDNSGIALQFDAPAVRP